MQRPSLGHEGLVYNLKQSMCEHVQQSFAASASRRKRMSALLLYEHFQVSVKPQLE